ncbi:unnamed protein product [Hymenolepis diminuta]|uniref:EGF-like domain-containing protein n=1 Tax=Hymenolepis diminuta TaxID=6216 RepID=A0A0R3SSH2_HYMDI|nr:unnamed protein product [Hymenolepis diminuta]VUZ52178.1 unnamed protein product [Hymenolepis diminuta]
MKSVLVILCFWCVLSVGSLDGALYQHIPRYPSFTGCHTHTCNEGNYTGFGCLDGRCTYICKDGLCNGYSGTKEFLFPQMQTDLTRPWAPGAKNLYGCKGGDCGFWGGCNEGYCAGRYDFRDCGKSNCQYGPFRGYGCGTEGCQIICYDKRCHIDTYYGNQLQASRIDVALPTNITELKHVDLSNFVEMENDLVNLDGDFWRFYMKNSEAWERDKVDPDLWVYLFHRVGRLERKGPQVHMPGDGCDMPQCGCGYGDGCGQWGHCSQMSNAQVQ